MKTMKTMRTVSTGSDELAEALQDGRKGPRDDAGVVGRQRVLDLFVERRVVCCHAHRQRGALRGQGDEDRAPIVGVRLPACKAKSLQLVDQGRDVAWRNRGGDGASRVLHRVHHR
jgi:hypothetical protein